ncbi:hypothetical protein KUCAC02_007994, partial [Chaenocephalus aceratus]
LISLPIITPPIWHQPARSIMADNSVSLQADLFEHLARIVSGGCEPQTRSLKAVSLTGDQATSVCVR